MSRAEPDRARRRSSTYRNRCAPFGASLSATRTVSVEAVCAPARGERIDRCGVGALAGAPAPLVRAMAAEVVLAADDVLLEVPLPQPLAARTNAKLAQSDPALNLLVTCASHWSRQSWHSSFTYLLTTPFSVDPSSNGAGRLCSWRRLS